MRKNLLSLGQILKQSIDENLDALFNTYNIKLSEIRTLSGETEYKTIFNAGLFLLNKSLETGMDKNQAIAQITSGNLALITGHGDITSESIREIGKVISKKVRNKNAESRLTNMSYLRKEIGRQVFGEWFTLNAETYSLGDSKIVFSSNDQVDGVKLPTIITPKLAFLIGAYRTDNCGIYPKKNRFKISGREDDEKFYTSVLEGLIEDIFNIHIRTAIRNRTKINKRSGDTSQWKDVYMEIMSKAHFEFLRDSIGLFDEESGFQEFYIENFETDRSVIKNSYNAYLMGIIAAGGNITRAKPIIEFKDHNSAYIPEIIRIMGDQEINIPYKNPRPGFIKFNSDGLRAMINYQTEYKLTENQIGLFVNPRHTEEIESRFSHYID